MALLHMRHFYSPGCSWPIAISINMYQIKYYGHTMNITCGSLLFVSVELTYETPSFRVPFMLKDNSLNFVGRGLNVLS